MGTCLYPATTNVANLEVLAGVPAGTHARLKALERHHAELIRIANLDDACDRQDFEYHLWTQIHNDRDLDAMSTFLLFGWGKFDGRDIAEGPCGSLSPADWPLIGRLFARNGIDAPVSLCEGVCWS